MLYLLRWLDTEGLRAVCWDSSERSNYIVRGELLGWVSIYFLIFCLSFYNLFSVLSALMQNWRDAILHWNISTRGSLIKEPRMLGKVCQLLYNIALPQRGSASVKDALLWRRSDFIIFWRCKASLRQHTHRPPTARSQNTTMPRAEWTHSSDSDWLTFQRFCISILGNKVVFKVPGYKNWHIEEDIVTETLSSK